MLIYNRRRRQDRPSATDWHTRGRGYSHLGYKLGTLRQGPRNSMIPTQPYAPIVAPSGC